MFFEFVKFEIKQWFPAYQDQVCAWFSLARLPTEAARKLFLYHFLKENREIALNREILFNTRNLLSKKVFKIAVIRKLLFEILEMEDDYIEIPLIIKKVGT